MSRFSSVVPSQAGSHEVACQSAGGLRGHNSVSAALIVHENEWWLLLFFYARLIAYYSCSWAHTSGILSRRISWLEMMLMPADFWWSSLCPCRVMMNFKVSEKGGEPDFRVRKNTSPSRWHIHHNIVWAAPDKAPQLYPLSPLLI